MNQRNLALCGLIAPPLLIFMTILGGAMRPGYSYIADTMSELLSPGSPNRLLLVVLFTTYALLMALFGIGILLFVRRSARSAWIGSLGAWTFVAAGIVNLATATVFPQDPWGSAPTLAGEMHMSLSGVIGVLQLFSMVNLGIWFGFNGKSTRLAVYSLGTAGAVVLSTAFFIAMVGTPLMGLAERIPILIGLLWTFVLALWMVSRSSIPGLRSS
jgi:hypothetical protein